MVTEVVMKRELFDEVISQQSKSEFFSATDLVKAGNKWRAKHGMPIFNMATWFQTGSVKEFIASLQKKYGSVKINSKGKNGHTWVHPFLFIDMALAISPDLKIEVYSWLYDHLLKYRNDSGDSYKKMSGALYQAYGNKTKFPAYIKMVAENIKNAIGVENWESATERQLELRDDIHDNVAVLAEVLSPDDAVRIGIKKALEEYKEVK